MESGTLCVLSDCLINQGVVLVNFTLRPEVDPFGKQNKASI